MLYAQPLWVMPFMRSLCGGATAGIEAVHSWIVTIGRPRMRARCNSLTAHALETARHVMHGLAIIFGLDRNQPPVIVEHSRLSNKRGHAT